MKNSSEKHRKIVRQRIMSAVITLLILGVISVGLYYAAQVVMIKVNERQKKEADTKTETVAQAETKEPEEPEVSEDWYVSENEVSENTAGPDDPESVSSQEISAEDMRTDEIIKNMSLEEKICQLFIVKPEDLTGIDNVTAARDATKEALEKYPVGGIIYFAGNIVDPKQLETMLENTQSYGKEISSLPLFLCIDEENGSITRIASNEKFDEPLFPEMWDMALSENAADTVRNAGSQTGRYLKKYGFNVDFAPDADAATSSENAIGKRSFGSDPEETARLSLEYAKGLSGSDIIPCFKHYPGLGDTEQDTHLGLATTRKTEKELEESDLIPFKNAVDNKAEMILAGHISCPLVTGDDTPASLSEVMITQILREKMGYEGIVITDSLQMASITDNYTCSEAVKLAVKAGADILLMPADLEEAVNALKEAVKSGEITEERIDMSLKRILRAKQDLP